MANCVSVSVIICTCNRKPELLECLQSLQTLKSAPLEVIVVDNHSSDGTIAAIRDKFPTTTIIANPANFGTAYSRNQAIKIARGDHVWFLDSDTVITHPDVLNNMLEYFAQHPDTGALGGQMVRDGEKLLYWVMLEKSDKKIPVEPGVVHEYPSHYMATCNCMVPRKWLLKIGGFDLHYFYYCEDLDLGMRLGRLGLKNVFRGDCCVLHKFAQKERAGTYYLFYRNLLRCMIINRSALYLLFFPFTQTKRVIGDYLTLRRDPRMLAKIKTLNAARKGGYTGLFGAAKLGGTIMFAIARACLWNWAHIIPTMYYKWRAPDHLARTTT